MFGVQPRFAYTLAAYTLAQIEDRRMAFLSCLQSAGTKSNSSRLKRAFHVQVNNEQWEPDFEPVRQTPGSVKRYGELAHKGGDFRVNVWRPVLKEDGAVEKILESTERNGIALGYLPRGKGSLVLTGMYLQGPVEFDKVTAFLESLLLRPNRWPLRSPSSDWRDA